MEKTLASLSSLFSHDGDCHIRRAIVVLVVLAIASFSILAFAIHAMGAIIASDNQVDYGEGAVLTQYVEMLRGQMYKPLAQPPYIVFHYPPLYYWATFLADTVVSDPFAAGRLVSALFGLVAVLCAGVLAFQATERRGQALVRASALVGTVGLAPTFVPVLYWWPLMRVDMMAIGLTLAGLVAAAASHRRPPMLHLAGLLFVAALFTKQNSVAAPLATLLVCGALWPRPTIRVFLLWGAIGAALLAALAAWTDGEALRHLLLYNMNRITFAEAWMIPWWAATSALAILLAMWAAAARLRDLRGEEASWRAALSRLRERRDMFVWALAAVYFALTLLGLLQTFKSGAWTNYFIEPSLALAVLAGLGVARAAEDIVHRDRLRPALMVVVCVAAFMGWRAAGSPGSKTEAQAAVRDSAPLAEALAAVPDPVISEDMSVLVRLGRRPFLEPAIIPELVATGAFDETPVLDRVRAGAFGAIVVLQQGDAVSQRYTPAFLAAMTRHYQPTARFGIYVMYVPRPSMPGPGGGDGAD